MAGAGQACSCCRKGGNERRSTGDERIRGCQRWRRVGSSSMVGKLAAQTAPGPNSHPVPIDRASPGWQWLASPALRRPMRWGQALRPVRFKHGASHTVHSTTHDPGLPHAGVMHRHVPIAQQTNATCHTHYSTSTSSHRTPDYNKSSVLSPRLRPFSLHLRFHFTSLGLLTFPTLPSLRHVLPASSAVRRASSSRLQPADAATAAVRPASATAAATATSQPPHPPATICTRHLHSVRTMAHRLTLSSFRCRCAGCRIRHGAVRARWLPRRDRGETHLNHTSLEPATPVPPRRRLLRRRCCTCWPPWLTHLRSRTSPLHQSGRAYPRTTSCVLCAALCC